MFSIGNREDNTVKQFHYEDTNHSYALTGITDRRGERFSTYIYDNNRRMIEEKHHALDENNQSIEVNKLTIDYDPLNKPVDVHVITNSLGVSSDYEVIEINGVSKLKSITGSITAMTTLYPWCILI